MAEDLNIPDELKGTFMRLMNQVPNEQRTDPETQKIIQVYLKLGGERLAKQYIETIKLKALEKRRQNEAAAKSLEESDIDDDSSDPNASEFDSFRFSFK